MSCDVMQVHPMAAVQMRVKRDHSLIHQSFMLRKSSFSKGAAISGIFCGVFSEPSALLRLQAY
jgi:hypothetical protein